MAVVDDTEAWNRLIASLAQWSRTIDGSSPGMRTIEEDGFVATMTPAAPSRSIVNDVVYWDAEVLDAAYEQLDAAYREAGIDAWTVWVPDTDPATAKRLAARDHLLDADPEAMVLDLDEVVRPLEPPGFNRDADPLTVARINDVAYGVPEMFERALADMGSRDGLHVYTAGAHEPSSCLMAFDHGDDCSVWLVATLPRARGQGLAGALMAHALADARERGRSTSTLQATDLGRPVYERLGYRSLGEIQLWEKRRG